MGYWQCTRCFKIFDEFRVHWCDEMPDWLKQLEEVELGEEIAFRKLGYINPIIEGVTNGKFQDRNRSNR